MHTNSWGGGSMDYDLTARMIDEGGVNYPNMTLLFGAGNAGVDANSNGEVDDESLTNQGQSKNALVIGASETNIDLFTNTWGTTKYSAPISTDTRDENPEGMAAFSSRGPTTDDRIKPDMSAPGTFIASTRSRVASGTGWGAIDADYLYMGGTSMATPVTAGVTALLYQHLDDNLGYDNASSALVRGCSPRRPTTWLVSTPPAASVPTAPRPSHRMAMRAGAESTCVAHSIPPSWMTSR